MNSMSPPISLGAAAAASLAGFHGAGALPPLLAVVRGDLPARGGTARRPRPARLFVTLFAVFSLALAGCGDKIQTEEGPTSVSETSRPTPEPVNDDVLRARVNAALGADSRVQASAITVTVARGQVTLDGLVPADQITRADAIAREVAGVEEVINALRPAMPAS
ncbi:BON domain-containing protein [Azoarcus indigens]|uniref:BON domain-containing protein n=2 Tax=Azoarcus indigens TaxID=29545 RepID=A0A4R6ECN4_9RHOO|nr:BON domain-containing protein [Azoarcus indigens]